MPKVFISYRRADSQYVTDHIYEYFQNQFEAENVFLDVGNIPFGVDFRVYLREQVAAHDVVLVIIGPDWSRIMQERAGEINDFVRIEIENVLQQDKLIIPVLVMEAQMPDFSVLPESIQELQWRNSAQIRRQPDFSSDCLRIVDGIQQFIESNAKKTEPARKVQPDKKKSTREAHPSRLADLMPQLFDMMTISAGLFETDKAIYEVPEFQIAKYPVTNAQFAEFMLAGGYRKSDLWTDQGWVQKNKAQWKQPRYWTDEVWNRADYPVIGVSWFEAVAYCRWLAISTGQSIMLPTEVQWQRAAQGDDAREYPWGNKWSCQRCNCDVRPCKSSGTTPVNQFGSKAESPFGVSDMVGNVRQWCLTDFETNEDDVNFPAMYRVLRGGAWSETQSENLRVTSRVRYFPDGWSEDIGFRFVISS